MHAGVRNEKNHPVVTNHSCFPGEKIIQNPQGLTKYWLLMGKILPYL
jgi:hypothetical protein